MEILDSVYAHLTPTTWLIITFVLIGIETFAPIAVFLWLGISGLMVAVISVMLPISPQAQLILFAILCPIITFMGRYLVPINLKTAGADGINDRKKHMIGKVHTLNQDVKAGKTQLKVGDSMWPAECAVDLKKGDEVIVTDMVGITLILTRKESSRTLKK